MQRKKMNQELVDSIFTTILLAAEDIDQEEARAKLLEELMLQMQALKQNDLIDKSKLRQALKEHLALQAEQIALLGQDMDISASGMDNLVLHAEAIDSLKEEFQQKLKTL